MLNTKRIPSHVSWSRHFGFLSPPIVNEPLPDGGRLGEVGRLRVGQPFGSRHSVRKVWPQGLAGMARVAQTPTQGLCAFASLLFTVIHVSELVFRG